MLIVDAPRARSGRVCNPRQLPLHKPESRVVFTTRISAVQYFERHDLSRPAGTVAVIAQEAVNG